MRLKLRGMRVDVHEGWLEYIMRGGSWSTVHYAVDAADRTRDRPQETNPFLGTRFIRTREEKSMSSKKGKQNISGHKVPTTPVIENWVEIPGGTYVMGSPKDSPDHYKDEHQMLVTVDPILVMDTHVQQREWEALTGSNPSSHKGPDLPVEMVSWFDVVNFANIASENLGLAPAYKVHGDEVTLDLDANGCRLPTEEEYEYFCRAGTTGSRYGELDEIAWYSANSGGQSHPVRTKKPNDWKLYDTLGNCWSWCWNVYESEAVNRPWYVKGVAEKLGIKVECDQTGKRKNGEPVLRLLVDDDDEPALMEALRFEAENNKE